MNNPMVLRVEIAQQALEHFHGKPLEWGRTDCARLAAYVLKPLGYKPGLSRFGDYKTELGARRAVRRQGMTDTPDWLDTIHGLVRIPPAAALPADIVGMPGAGGWTSLTVALGNGRLLGFHPDAGVGSCTVVEPLAAPIACWRAAPCRS